jgi:hypothetical protein
VEDNNYTSSAEKIHTLRECILLNGGHLELGLTRHSDNATHDGPITNGEDDTSASSLDDKSRCKCQITSLKSILRSRMDDAWDWVTGAKVYKYGKSKKQL